MFLLHHFIAYNYYGCIVHIYLHIWYLRGFLDLDLNLQWMIQVWTMSIWKDGATLDLIQDRHQKVLQEECLKYKLTSTLLKSPLVSSIFWEKMDQQLSSSTLSVCFWELTSEFIIAGICCKPKAVRAKQNSQLEGRDTKTISRQILKHTTRLIGTTGLVIILCGLITTGYMWLSPLPVMWCSYWNRFFVLGSLFQ